MILIFVLIVIIIVTLIGYSFISLGNLMPTLSNLEKLSFSYGIGVGLIAFQLLFYSIGNILYNPYDLGIPWLIFLLITAIIKRKRIAKFKITYPLKRFKTLDMLSKILLVGIVLTVVFVLIEAPLRPLNAWDAWYKWYFGAKAFFLAHKIDRNFLFYANYSDPPIINLFLTFVFTLLGKVEDQITLLLFTSFYLSLLLMLFTSLKKFITTRYTLLFVFLFATLDDAIRQAGHYDVGYADLPLAYFFLGSFLLLHYFKETYSQRILVVLNLFLAITALIKFEALPYYLFAQLILLVLLFKAKKLKMILYSLISLILIGSWYLYHASMHLSLNDDVSTSIYWQRIPLVSFKILIELLNVQRWNLLWPVFFISLFLAKYTKTLKILFVLFFLQFLSYFWSYLATNVDPVYRLHGSLDRLLLQISPLAVYFIAITVSQLTKNNEMLFFKNFKWYNHQHTKKNKK